MENVIRYKIYADRVVFLHAFWSLLVFSGMVIMFFWPPYAAIEIAVVSFTLLVALPFGGTCPLTLLERLLRSRADSHYGNKGGFVVTYVNKIFGTRFAPAQARIAIGILYVLTYVAAVLLLVYH